MNDTKIKFEKPVFFAQSSGEGSFSAGCPLNARGGLLCLTCERMI